ncbi:restriction endonuclease subunit S [Gilvimarinus xylanilyticus]|uniref:Restriction endonuclease subunit S n=1 Tax=Gilvimarinus xylanilyticus TaxID=2944139 RepID=A0A9X2HX61_9GAMM|nr:restriction endonuclease subunit S [Gilvimarinus xylanilyticus]MCP8900048.1 restriction endonuclease subunit S [Gilvimarinus xylanilyticus]
MKQVQYTLPNTWTWKTLDDVSEKITDGTHHSPKVQHLEWAPGRFKYITSKNIKNNGMKLDDISYIDQNIHDEIYARCPPEFEDQLLTKDGAMTGTCCLNELNEPFSLLSSVALIKQKRSIIQPKYLNYYLQSHVGQNFLLGDISGAAITRTNIKKLKSTPVPLAPFSEQKRIVEKLDALLSRIDTVIEHFQESVKLSDALYASSLDQVFEKVYSDYSTKPLSVLASKIGSGATPKGGQKAYKKSGISLIRSLNVYDSEFKLEGLAFIDDDQAVKLSNVVVEEGDVLLNITGASIARCCVAPVDFLPARVNQHVCIIRPNEELNSTYLNYLLISPKFKAALLFQGAGGATRQALTKVMVSNLDIPLPPLKTQTELVGKVNLLSQKNRALKESVNSKISDLITLKTSILDSAFKGEL